MPTIPSNNKSYIIQNIVIVLYLFIYLATGINTELKLITWKPIPEMILEDFRFYERALDDALKGKNPYAIQHIGTGYFYPPPALLVVEIFRYIPHTKDKFLLYSIFNVSLLMLMVKGVVRHYGYSTKRVWYWYVLCLGFAPFLELLHIGQINVITMFGIYLFLFWLDSSSAASGFGLSLAILTKVTPVIFFGFLAANKKFKTITSTLIWIFLFTFLAALRHGVSPILEYPKTFMWLSNQYPINANSQSLASILKSMFVSTIQPSEYQYIQKILGLFILTTIIISSILFIKGKQPKEPLFIVTAFGITLLPNIMWYHHYVFILLPILIWMGWTRLNPWVVTWCLAGLLIAQIDRYYLSHGLLIHLFIHISILSILYWQARQYYSQHKTLKVKITPCQ